MAYDAFIKIDKVTGETLKKGKDGQIEIYSFSWGASNPTTVSSNSGISGGKVSISSFNVMKKTDRSSAALFLACCGGEVYPKMTVTLRKTAGAAEKPSEDYIIYEFENVMVESIQWSGSTGGDDTPTESVSFAFTKVVIKYKPQKTDGSLEAAVNSGWDIKLGTKA